jgi:hypothetical protein
MAILIKVLLYFVSGFAQWSVATLRTWYIAKENTKLVIIVVFIEAILLVGVTAYIINNPKQWWLLFSEALGGAIGAGVCMQWKIRKRRKE